MKSGIKKHVVYFIKGIGIGAANIIPGVSGGTIALITGIFEELIDSIKSLDFKAIKLIFSGKWREFEDHTNFLFLLSVFGGAAAGIYALAFVLEPLFLYYPHYVWAFFFGLILASVFFVSRRIQKWTFTVFLFFLAGVFIALFLTLYLKPASENGSVWYVFICGIVAICSMILPGLSGSYVLLLMGNYELVMIHSVKNMDLGILIPLLFGAFIGLISFSYLLSWVFKKYRDFTIAILIGFIFGSLGILWPWKNPIYQSFGNVKEKIVGYDFYLPATLNKEVLFAILLMISGFLIIWVVEYLANQSQKKA